MSSFDSGTLNVGSLGFPSTGFSLGIDSNGNVFCTNTSSGSKSTIYMTYLNSLTTGTFYVGTQYSMTAVFSKNLLGTPTITPPNTTDSITNTSYTGATLTFKWTPNAAVTNFPFQFQINDITIVSVNYTTNNPVYSFTNGWSGHALTISTTNYTNDTLAIVGTNSGYYAYIPVTSMPSKSYMEYVLTASTSSFSNCGPVIGILNSSTMSADFNASGFLVNTTLKDILCLFFNGTAQGIYGVDPFNGPSSTTFNWSPALPSTIPSGAVIGIAIDFTNLIFQAYVYSSTGTLLAYSGNYSGFFSSTCTASNSYPMIGLVNSKSGQTLNCCINNSAAYHLPSGYTYVF